MFEHTCKYCGKTFYSKQSFRVYCDNECYANSLKNAPGHRKGARNKIKHGLDASANAGASDSQNIKYSKPLVDPGKCRRCVYSMIQSNKYHCGYLFFTDRTRTAQHPEGLTSTCYEFKPKPRKRKKAYDDN